MLDLPSIVPLLPFSKIILWFYLLYNQFSGNWEGQKDKLMSSIHHLTALHSYLFDHLLLPKVPFPVCSSFSATIVLFVPLLAHGANSPPPFFPHPTNLGLLVTFFCGKHPGYQIQKKNRPDKGKFTVFGIWWWLSEKISDSFPSQEPASQSPRERVCFGCHPILSTGLHVTIGSTQPIIPGMLKSPW